MKRPAVSDNRIIRLHRIEGQVRGLQRMIAGKRKCTEVLMQVASVREALRQVGLATLHRHLESRVADAIVRGEATATEELIPLVAKFARLG